MDDFMKKMVREGCIMLRLWRKTNFKRSFWRNEDSVDLMCFCSVIMIVNSLSLTHTHFIIRTIFVPCKLPLTLLFYCESSPTVSVREMENTVKQTESDTFSIRFNAAILIYSHMLICVLWDVESLKKPKHSTLFPIVFVREWVTNKQILKRFG